MQKYDLLNAFIDAHKHLPEQGTDEWKALRRGFIGGSEIASVLKKNKNKSTNKLVMEKIGFDPFKGNYITHWGNVFEELIRLRCEEEFNCSIKETGSIPYKHGCLSYSPDGLAVVPTITLERYFGEKQMRDAQCVDLSAPAQLVLFEFKCPHSRIATNEIPEHYQPQINIGMNIIDIMEIGVFVQATYRRCTFDDLQYNTRHVRSGHFKPADTSNHPLECGFMVIYANDDPDEMLQEALLEVGDATEVHLDSGHTVVDVGPVTDMSLLEDVLGRCVSKSFRVDYAFRHKYDQSVFARGRGEQMYYNQSLQYKASRALGRAMRQHSNVVCVMPYKLLSAHTTLVPKNASYIEDTDAHTKATRVLKCIEEHRSHTIKTDAAKSVRGWKL